VISPRRYVLDANALVGFFEGRAGIAEKVRHLAEESLRQTSPLLMSAVNWGEVFYVAWKRHGEDAARGLETAVQDLGISILAADRERATRSAALKHKHQLSYADCFAAELAIEKDAWLVTADPEFVKLGKTLKLYRLPRHSK
jgi:predicted nucleic acid-binding protein